MHHHAGRLVHHQQIFVLIDDVQRDLLRLDLRLEAGRPQQLYRVAGGQPETGLGWPAVDHHARFFDPALHLDARGVTALRGQIAIQPLAALIGIDGVGQNLLGN
jgi:hypothetical protein